MLQVDACPLSALCSLPPADTRMDANREGAHSSNHQAALDATPVNMKQYLKRKSGGVASSPCSPHLSRLGGLFNKSLAVTSPLTPMSEASTPVTEVTPFTAEEAATAECDDDATTWSIQCASPHGQADTEKKSSSFPNALLFQEPMSSPSGGLAKLAVSETHEDDLVNRFRLSSNGIANNPSESKLAPCNFDVGTLSSEELTSLETVLCCCLACAVLSFGDGTDSMPSYPLQFCSITDDVFAHEKSKSNLGENHHPNSSDGFFTGCFQVPNTTVMMDENSTLGGFSQETVMSQDATMDGFAFSSNTRFLRDPPDAAKSFGARLDIVTSETMSIDHPSSMCGNGGTPSKLPQHLACLGDRAKSWMCDLSGVSASPFRKRSRAHSPPRKSCSAPQQQEAVSLSSSPLLSLSSTIVPSPPLSDGSHPTGNALPDFPPSPMRPFLRRGLSLNNMSPSKLVVERSKKLPTFQDECVLDCVSVETVQELCMGEYREMYDKVMIIDCRFDYEYEGGHVSSNEWLSVHHVPPHRKDYMEELLSFSGKSDGLVLDNDRVCVIFHCEFSKQRGPKMMSHVRSLDRQHNHARYPLLYYPELYVMKGGYKQFFLNQGKMVSCPCIFCPMTCED